jgi:ABC-type spermidine/putrescine transport system permease subunit I
MSTQEPISFKLRERFLRSNLLLSIIQRIKNRDRLLAITQAGVGIAWMTVFLLIPLLYIIGLSFAQRGAGGVIIYEFSLSNYSRILVENITLFPPNPNTYLLIIFQSIKIGIIVTAITMVIGYIPGYFLGRTDSKWKPVLLLLVVLPFWAPLIVRYYSWMMVLGNNGFIPSIAAVFGFEIDGLLYNELTVISGLVQALLPFMILPVYNSVSKIDGSLIESAKTMNATPLRTFYEVTLPLSLPGIAAGALLVFILSVGSYLAPAMLGGPADMMIANLIERTFGANADWPFASALSVVYLLLLFLIVSIFDRLANIDEMFARG